MNEQAKRGPGRPRKEESAIPEHIRKKREQILERRRGGSVGQLRQRLAVSENALDRENFTYRWVNDDPGRVQYLTENDVWEIVPDPDREVKADAESGGSALSVVTGKDDYGRPLRSYLMRKPKVYYEEDQKLKRQKIDERVNKIERGDDADTAVSRSYKPEGMGIRIDDGRN